MAECGMTFEGAAEMESHARDCLQCRKAEELMDTFPRRYYLERRLPD